MRMTQGPEGAPARSPGGLVHGAGKGKAIQVRTIGCRTCDYVQLEDCSYGFLVGSDLPITTVLKDCPICMHQLDHANDLRVRCYPEAVEALAQARTHAPLEFVDHWCVCDS